jgi:asparagine synthase (glutamine-hydrolysing)
MVENSPATVRTFTIGFGVRAMDEAPFARMIARHLNTEHHEEYISGHDMQETLPRVAGMYEEPFSDHSSIPTFLLSQMTRRHVTVALSGDGGDEQHFGYTRYRRVLLHHRLARMPLLFRRGLVACLHGAPSLRLRRWANMLTEDSVNGFYACLVRQRISDLLPDESSSPRPLRWDRTAAEVMRELGPARWHKVAPAIDMLSYLPDDILTKVDRASMAVSLEVRVPLLDYRLVELACRLPHNMKYRCGRTKHILRRLLAKRVPEHLWTRPKRGFAIPLGIWFRSVLRSWVMDEMTSGATCLDAFIDHSAALRLVQDHMDGRWDYSRLIWTLLSLRIWARRIGVSG